MHRFLISVFALAVPRVAVLVLIWLALVASPGQQVHGFVFLQPRTDYARTDRVISLGFRISYWPGVVLIIV